MTSKVARTEAGGETAAVAQQQLVIAARGHNESFCTECGLAFNLLRDSPLRLVCGECFEKLGRPALVCDDCRRAIVPGDKCHLAWCCLCVACARLRERTSWSQYPRETIAWSQ